MLRSLWDIKNVQKIKLKLEIAVDVHSYFLR
ncbi:hypothetical protein CKL83_17590 [Bacillus anthracis]|uniref:Uncharacterized protein n=2 Tax=Bacillus anthracis TaxID=1392 RepID=Q81QN2_BACAN|nr:hypothetical protein BA_2391 [Bacillus anthracis str. Ames]AAT35337.1 hypothetical protein GBAA_2391 [Bacillus anthracis str. 'Ames Ancestor']APT25860.1 hypothetical protein BVB96_12300 [Bacillus anthracis]EDR19261.1 hypothetical protein BAC_2412 [Bacillus anthracis str. A0488]EDR87807.1 hypothetical protein BAQ_2435 [Bacillus anthracis str. A0193]EDR94373.1 hypothetical protein BAH_2442 [Bacillus anthracis str. A0442]EDS97292.1 hypothetical protein BAK_2473 [Bacillus anthracis str. A0389]